MRLQVLIVDDEAAVRNQLCEMMRAEGHTAVGASDGREALLRLSQSDFDVMITDVRMPNMDGFELFRRVRKAYPAVSAILMTEHAQLEDAVEMVKLGAHDYIAKPFSPDELLLRVQRLSTTVQLNHELREARAILRQQREREGIALIGRCAAMRALQRRIDTVAPTEASVIIVGESGTGKELIARAIHEGSARRDKPFMAINCAALPETLIEAELFGHEKGAFTGATHRRPGRFQAAQGGTLLLDEVGEIPLSMQAKLLRVLQERRVDPLGGGRSVPVDVRILCATHRNLKTLIAEGRFREDLYYRLNVLSIRVPSLRERPSDLPLLVSHFYRKYAQTDAAPDITPRAWATLSSYPFPGNVRELEHAIQHAVVMSQEGQIDLAHLPPDIAGIELDEASVPTGVRPLAESMREFERRCLLQALSATRGGRKRAADMLGISRKTLWEKLKMHGITESDLEEVGAGHNGPVEFSPVPGAV